MLAHFVDWILALIKPMGVSISECDSLFKGNPSSFLLSKCQIGGVVGPMDHIRDALWIHRGYCGSWLYIKENGVALCAFEMVVL